MCDAGGNTRRTIGPSAHPSRPIPSRLAFTPDPMPPSDDRRKPGVPYVYAHAHSDSDSRVYSRFISRTAALTAAISFALREYERGGEGAGHDYGHGDGYGHRYGYGYGHGHGHGHWQHMPRFEPADGSRTTRRGAYRGTRGVVQIFGCVARWRASTLTPRIASGLLAPRIDRGDARRRA